MADEEDTKAEQEVEEAINPDDNEEGNDDQKKEVDLEDPYIGAIDYLEKHHIVDLFQVPYLQIFNKASNRPGFCNSRNTA